MNPEPLESRFHVRIGHIEIVVSAHDSAEALANARLEIMNDMPRFYDVIRTMEPSRFEVRPAA